MTVVRLDRFQTIVGVGWSASDAPRLIVTRWTIPVMDGTFRLGLQLVSPGARDPQLNRFIGGSGRPGTARIAGEEVIQTGADETQLPTVRVYGIIYREQILSAFPGTPFLLHRWSELQAAPGSYAVEGTTDVYHGKDARIVPTSDGFFFEVADGGRVVSFDDSHSALGDAEPGGYALKWRPRPVVQRAGSGQSVELGALSPSSPDFTV